MAVPTLWRTKQQRYRLVGEKCPSCTVAVFPPRKVCPHCGQTMTTSAVVSRELVFQLPHQACEPFTSRLAGDD